MFEIPQLPLLPFRRQSRVSYAEYFACRSDAARHSCSMSEGRDSGDQDSTGQGGYGSGLAFALTGRARKANCNC